MEKKESSGKVQAQGPSVDNQIKTGTDFDNYDIIKILLAREKNKSLGVVLKTSRSSSLISTKSKKNKKEETNHFPIITSIDKDSPAEFHGLQIGDNILEINGKRTNGLSDKKIGDLIKSKGDSIQKCPHAGKNSRPARITHQPGERNLCLCRPSWGPNRSYKNHPVFSEVWRCHRKF